MADENNSQSRFYPDGERLVIAPTNDLGMERIKQERLPPDKAPLPYDAAVKIIQYARQNAEVNPQGCAGAEIKYGRVVTLTKAQALTGQPFTGVHIPDNCESLAWTLCVQANRIPWVLTGQEVSPTPAGMILGIITFTYGGCTFTKVIQITSRIARHVPIVGHLVGIDFVWINLDPALSLDFDSLDLNVGIEKGTAVSVERVSPRWLRQNPEATLNNVYLIDGGATPTDDNDTIRPDNYMQGGCVMAASGSIVAIDPADAASGVWPMYFDTNDPATLGVSMSVPIITGNPCNAALQNFNFDDNVAPQAVYNRGLVFALSSTPKLYTACRAGTTCVVDTKIGS